MAKFLVGGVIILAGVFAWLAVGLKWEWFIKHYKVVRIYRFLGDRGGTWFYIILGLGFVTWGLAVIFGCPGLGKSFCP